MVRNRGRDGPLILDLRTGRSLIGFAFGRGRALVAYLIEGIVLSSLVRLLLWVALPAIGPTIFLTVFSSFVVICVTLAPLSVELCLSVGRLQDGVSQSVRVVSASSFFSPITKKVLPHSKLELKLQGTVSAADLAGD